MSLECAAEGMKLMQRCSFAMRDMHCNLARLVRHVAWEAAHATGDEVLADDAEMASKSAAMQRLIVSVLDMEGGAREIHFRRNLEAHLFKNP